MYARIGEKVPSLGCKHAESVESLSAAAGGAGHSILRLTRVLHGGTYLMGDGCWCALKDVEEREEELETAEEADEMENERDLSAKNP